MVRTLNKRPIVPGGVSPHRALTLEGMLDRTHVSAFSWGWSVASKKNAKLHHTPDCVLGTKQTVTGPLREQSQFKFGEINRFGPPLKPYPVKFMGDTFFFGSFIFHLQKTKNKKGAPEASEKNIFLLLEILGLFFSFFFITMVSIGKVHFSAKCPFGRIGGLNFFFDKKNGCRIRGFSQFFMPKNDLFLNFWTPLIFGPEALFFFSAFH